MDKPSLALITVWFPPNGGNFIREQAIALFEKYDVHVIVVSRGLIPETTSKEFDHYRLWHIKFPFLPKRTKWTLDRFIRIFSKRFNAIYQKEKFDIVHAQTYLAGLIAYDWSQKTQQPYFITLHGSIHINNTYRSFEIDYIEKSFQNATNVICVGKNLENAIHRNFNHVSTTVVPNLVSSKRFKKSSHLEPFRFILLGHLDHNKGAQEVIDSFEMMDHHLAELWLLGDLRMKEDLKITSPKIKHFQWVDIAEIPSYLNQCNCVISFSKFETFGITVIEGMACGLPIIYTASGGPEYNVPHWAGIRVERRQDDLIRAMEQIMSKYDSYDKETIRRHALANFSDTVVVNKLEEIYSQNPMRILD